MKHQVPNFHQVRTRPKLKVDWFNIKDIEWALSVCNDEDCLRFMALLFVGVRPGEVHSFESFDIAFSNDYQIALNVPSPSR